MAENKVIKDNNRRTLLKKLAVGTATVTSFSILPDKWTSPIVEFGTLPAHAITSGTPAITSFNTEEGRYAGRHNGDRPTWYFNRPMRNYPQQFILVVDGCVKIRVVNNGIRFVSDSTIIKQSDVSGRGMAVITSSSCHSKTARIIAFDY